jgi:hypothetical protein
MTRGNRAIIYFSFCFTYYVDGETTIIIVVGVLQYLCCLEQGMFFIAGMSLFWLAQRMRTQPASELRLFYVVSPHIFLPSNPPLHPRQEF